MCVFIMYLSRPQGSRCSKKKNLIQMQKYSSRFQNVDTQMMVSVLWRLPYDFHLLLINSTLVVDVFYLWFSLRCFTILPNNLFSCFAECENFCFFSCFCFDVGWPVSIIILWLQPLLIAFCRNFIQLLEQTFFNERTWILLLKQ